MKTKSDVKIGIIGCGDVGKCTPNDVHTVVEVFDTEVFSVNGILYEPVSQPKRLPNGSIHSTVRDIYLRTYLELLDITNGSEYQRKLDSTIDIIKEFGLIELKKSNLSKWDRDEVVRIFNKKYKKYENN